MAAKTKPLEQTPGTLFEREEIPTPEIVEGALLSVIDAHSRLAAVLKKAPPGSGRGITLERAKESAREVLELLRAARRVQLHNAWQR